MLCNTKAVIILTRVAMATLAQESLVRRASGASPLLLAASGTVDASASSHTSSTLLQREWGAHVPQTEGRPCPRVDVPIMRSSQIDAGRLDEELTLMLREQFMKMFALFQPGRVARLQPELTLLLDFLIFRYSVWEGVPLPGMALMNLRYRNERGTAADATGINGVEGPGLSPAQRTLYCLGAVLLRYMWTRAGNAAAGRHWGDAAPGSWQHGAWTALRVAESGYRLAALLNALAFFRTGRYRSLLERLLGARLVYAQPSATRAISYEYLNRQLVWTELSELLLFLLPLVNAAAVKRSLRSFLPRLPMLTGAQRYSQHAASGAQKEGAAAAAAEQEAGCGICGAAEIVTPYAALPCGHRFCYYCLRSQALADARFPCPHCLERVEALRPAAARAPLNEARGAAG